MATGETTTHVKTFISISYSLLGGDENHLLRRELHRIKDELLNEFVTVFDKTADVGEKDNWKDKLSDEKNRVETRRDDDFDKANDTIDILDDQINEIDTL